MLTKMEVSGALFETDQIGRDCLISPTVRLNDGSIRSLKRHTPGDFLQVMQDRLDMWPGKICWVVDVAICAHDYLQLGDNAEK
ncbi:hypothetical protein X742_32765 [Mesorhizobium sp. LNHC232B00]|nr:hypothetical protein X742_32765 [Mesorhizobium sp. LNHC232B00]